MIEGLHADYVNEDTGLLQLADLKAPKERRTRRDRLGDAILQERADAERRQRERVQQ